MLAYCKCCNIGISSHRHGNVQHAQNLVTPNFLMHMPLHYRWSGNSGYWYPYLEQSALGSSFYQSLEPGWRLTSSHSPSLITVPYLHSDLCHFIHLFIVSHALCIFIIFVIFIVMMLFFGNLFCSLVISRDCHRVTMKIKVTATQEIYLDYRINDKLCKCYVFYLFVYRDSVAARCCFHFPA